MSYRNALILTGPTGCGKTRLGIELAKRMDAEIVSMDSMTLYRGVNVGTAKPNPEEREQVPHHLIDVRDPWESASVAWWLEQAATCCRDVERRGRRVLFVGGTLLYFKAMLRGMFEGPAADASVRRRLTDEARQEGPESLHGRLVQVDPATAARVHPHDVRRVIRALEVWELTGRPISTWQTQWKDVGSEGKDDEASRGPTAVWLDLPRQELYSRIDARVCQMMDNGLIEEARSLRRLPLPVGREASQAVGYREAFAYLDGLASWKETIERIQTRSRNLAKRQVTWLRHLPARRIAPKDLTIDSWGSTID